MYALVSKNLFFIVVAVVSIVSLKSLGYAKNKVRRIDVSFEFDLNHGNNVTMPFLNFGHKRHGDQHDWYENLGTADKATKKKADILSRLLKIHIDRLRNQTDQMELVFLVDASGSVGLHNFRSELNFVRKLLSDFTVEPSATRVAVVTFGGKRNVRRNVDQISRGTYNDQKCYLLNKQLNNISYTGGGTYTRGALMEALAILKKSRDNAKKVVFLITDGFSNGGDPRPAANLLKSAGATIFTFGIRTGNVEELHDIASSPGYTHSYLLDSFVEFEALARRALHRDLKTGQYVPVSLPDNCNSLCTNSSGDIDVQNCCDDLAICACGIATGHYACICPEGYFGSGFRGFCQPCPNGTYASGEISGDSTSICITCPDVNHVTVKVPATSVDHCICASGFITDGSKCEVITCPKLKVPENGYLVKASACNNVVHAACGIRCRIGFYLTGDSIRLCGKNGAWSGNEPRCLLKTCPALRAPAHGRMRCHHEEDYQHQIKDDSTAYPIDTRCQFRCETGYQLRGSKVRNCLPLSQWDGLKATCKAIKCEPLKQIANGNVTPQNCTGPEKLPFATNCTLSCQKGFVLEGPRVRLCGGRTGVWSQRHSVNRCIDKTPPSITCPTDIVLDSLPGENYAYVNWSAPRVTDNTDPSPIVWTKPHIVFPWKAKIGTRKVIYVAQDSSGNKARCKFKVKVLDKEPPMMENCVDPPVVFTDREIGIDNATWDEPGFYDNSKTPVHVKQSHRPGESSFPLGTTRIVYNASDKYDNTATCVLNITVKDICQEIPNLTKGQVNCSKTAEHGQQCVVSCNEGQDFAVASTNFDSEKNVLLIKCNTSDPKWSESNIIPDCSESYVPKTVSQEGSIVLEGNETTVCDNQTTLRELSNYITADMRSKLLDICGNDIECNLVSFDPECEGNLSNSENLYTNVVRRRRDEFDFSEFPKIEAFMDDNTMSDSVNKLKRAIKSNHNNKMKIRKKKEKIEIKFKFVGRIIEENFENPRQGVQKLREKIESLTQSGKLNLLNNRTNQEIAKLALNLHLVFKDPHEICDAGSVLKKHNCVKCPLGTFYNASAKRCNPCSFGQYQNVSGSLECKYCPEYTYTKKMHAKSAQDCIPVCRPGYYSRRRRYHGSQLALEPCFACDFGFYQPKYGQTQCLTCPSNSTTENRGSTDIQNCLIVYRSDGDICETKPCLNNGQCTQDDDSFICECPERYIGSKCETFQNPCDSSPCLNEGICSVQNNSVNASLYSCTCKTGYSGQNCEQYIDECAVNPCQNNGTCLSTETDYACECKNGFEGQFCEIALDHCNPSPCEDGSTCRTVNETWQCSCRPGFLGRHCNLLPCDWIPCHVNSICVNVEEQNATRTSYRCTCPDGYTGENCTTKIDYCKSSPCLNNGQCISWIFNYTCACPLTYTGVNCETELSADYVMHFTKSGTTDYVLMKGPMQNLSEMTVCLWLQSKDTFNYGTVLSYATRYYDNAFTLTDYNGFVLYINGQKIVTDVKVNDGRWHFLCVTWEGNGGTWNVFIDGISRDNGTGLANGTFIQGNGTLVVGQEQDRVGGGFSESESFLGKLSLLDIWDGVLGEADIKYLLNTCEKYSGNVTTWSQMQQHIRGDIMIVNSTFCRGCPLPVVPFKGNINASDDLSEVTYYCDTGYIVRFRGREQRLQKIRCLKQGQWEGYYPPICIKKRCGFPGYFPRGSIQGRSYLFGDEIYYSCAAGYELRGNPHRICNSEGRWSGLPPICIGKTCKNLLAPENGDIEYIIEENERDDISILQAGQQLEFKCDRGYRLIGERYLTCLETGIWDYERPTCAYYGCPQPKEIEYGFVVLQNLNIPNETSNSNVDLNTTTDSLEKHYDYGDTVEYSCKNGYKSSINLKNTTKFTLQCSDNGTWIGSVPDCIPLKCPWPTAVENGKTFLKSRENDTIEIPVRKSPNTTESMDESNEDNESLQVDVSLKALLVLGAQISVICDSGYELIGESVRTCTENEEWSSTTPSCKLRECPLSNHPVYEFLNNAENEIVSENYTSVPLDDRHRKWLDVKNYSGSYRNLNYFIEGSSYAEEIVFTCENKGKIGLKDLNTEEQPSNLTWFCNENGQWEISNMILNDTDLSVFFNTSNDICQELTCVTPTIPEYGYISNDSNIDNHPKTINSTITFKCRNGYFLEGNEESLCLSNGSWSPIPSCKPVTCGKPPLLTNAVFKNDVVNGSTFTFGNMITYQCIPGYLMFGQPNARCLANGKWSRVYSKCSKLSCNKPKLPPGVTVHGRSYLFKDQLTYICPNGKKRGLITCKADGHWSDPPVCNGN